MSSDQPDSSSLPPPVRGVFGTKTPSAVTFVVGLLLFVLPFAEFKCEPKHSGQAQFINVDAFSISFTNTGVGLVFGNSRTWDVPLKQMLGNQSIDSIQQKASSQHPNYYALAALVMAALALGLSFVSGRAAIIISAFAGAASAIALVVLMIDLKKEAHNIIFELQKMVTAAHGESAPGLNVSFTPWFYIAIITMITASVFSYKRMLSGTR